MHCASARPLASSSDGDVVVVLAHDRREGGASQRAVGLVGDEDQPVPQDLQGDGSLKSGLSAGHDPAPQSMSMIRLNWASTWARALGPTTTVDSALLDDGRRP